MPTVDAIIQSEEKAAEFVVELLKLPLPKGANSLGYEGEFDPWDIFSCFYGSYSAEFDEVALTVLKTLANQIKRTDEHIAHEMFREVLCTHNLCDYGTSPRYCFPTQAFKKILPKLIQKWEEYFKVAWGEEALTICLGQMTEK